jgi:chromosome segregation ATPase
MSGNKGGGKRPSFVGGIKDTISGLTGKKQVPLTEEEKMQKELELQQQALARQQTAAQKKQEKLQALSNDLDQTRIDADKAQKLLNLTGARKVDTEAKKHLQSVKGQTLQAQENIKNWRQIIQDLTRQISDAEDFLESSAPVSLKHAEERCKDASEALKKAEQELAQVQNTVSGGVPKVQAAINASAPITPMRKGSMDRRDSSEEQKRDSGLSHSSLDKHQSTSGLPPPPPPPVKSRVQPPPLPKRPGLKHGKSDNDLL